MKAECFEIKEFMLLVQREEGESKRWRKDEAGEEELGNVP